MGPPVTWVTLLTRGSHSEAWVRSETTVNTSSTAPRTVWLNLNVGKELLPGPTYCATFPGVYRITQPAETVMAWPVTAKAPSETR